MHIKKVGQVVRPRSLNLNLTKSFIRRNVSSPRHLRDEYISDLELPCNPQRCDSCSTKHYVAKLIYFSIPNSPSFHTILQYVSTSNCPMTNSPSRCNSGTRRTKCISIWGKIPIVNIKAEAVPLFRIVVSAYQAAIVCQNFSLISAQLF